MEPIYSVAYGQPVMIKTGEPRSLRVPSSEARLRCGTQLQELGGGPRRRLLVVDNEPAFELSFYCGTCPLLFRRLETAREKLSLESMQERLTGALDDLDDGGVIDAFGALLPEGEYLPLLLSVEPRLIIPGKRAPAAHAARPDSQTRAAALLLT
ncbi:hypothetical protein ACH4N4_22920 [Streptomyces microflavus]|uniref:hypothetical protein n=1 Tax=Streptomyces griseus group TaxID=629295 RepID=UPI003661D87D